MGKGGNKTERVDIIDNYDPRVTGRAATKGTTFRYIPNIGDPILLIKTDEGFSVNWVSAGGTSGGGGTVMSVGLALPIGVFTVTGSPVTSSGTLTGSFTVQTANTVFAGPAVGAPDVPTFRALVTADLPAGTGTVTSVGLALPASIFNVTGSPVTSTGTLTGALADQNANLVFAGPAAGPAAPPTFRALVTADLPAGTGTVTSVALALPVGVFSVTGSPVTTAGTLTGDFIVQTARTFFAGPLTGVPAVPAFRLIATTDLPDPTSANVSAVHAMNADVGILYIDTSGGSFAVTLPNPATIANRTFVLIDSTGFFNTNPVNLTPFGAEKISGLAAVKQLSTAWGYFKVTTNGTDWFVGG